MIDVGAHHGHALFPFLEKGWRVFAFEPDDRNRAILEKRLAQADGAGSLVRLDNRAVSDQVRSGQVFYRSDQSTGISGLSAFRSEEHTSELQSLMRISYAVFCLKTKTNN